MPKPIQGACLCGAVKFEIDQASGPFEICHCNRCRKVSGSQNMATVGVDTCDFRMISGSEHINCFTAPILDRPPAYQVYFCALCGSPTPNPSPQGDWCEIPAGLFDNPLEIRPDKHIYVELMPDWDTITDQLPRYNKAELARLRFPD